MKTAAHYHVGINVPGLAEKPQIVGSFGSARALWVQQVRHAIEANASNLTPTGVVFLLKQLDEYPGDTVEAQNGRVIAVHGVFYWFSQCKGGEYCPWGDEEKPRLGKERTEIEGREAMPGHYFNSAGMEIYSLGQHIKRAFDAVEPGTFLTVRDICQAGVTDSIPRSRTARHATGPMTARLQGMLEGKCSRIEGIKVCRVDGVLGARKVRILSTVERQAMEDAAAEMGSPPY